MNKAIISGRITKQPEMQETTKGTKYCTFIIAVNPKRKDSKTEFITCTSWRKVAEFVVNYLIKGSHIILEGELVTHYTESVVDGTKTRIKHMNVSADKIEVIYYNKDQKDYEDNECPI